MYPSVSQTIGSPSAPDNHHHRRRHNRPTLRILRRLYVDRFRVPARLLSVYANMGQDIGHLGAQAYIALGQCRVLCRLAHCRAFHKHWHAHRGPCDSRHRRRRVDHTCQHLHQRSVQHSLARRVFRHHRNGVGYSERAGSHRRRCLYRKGSFSSSCVLVYPYPR